MEMFLYENSIEFIYKQSNVAEATDKFRKIKSDIEEQKLNKNDIEKEYSMFYWDIINIILNKMKLEENRDGVLKFISGRGQNEFIKDMIISLSNFPRKMYVFLESSNIKFLIDIAIKRDKLLNKINIDDNYYTNKFFNDNISYKDFCSKKYEKNNISLKLIEETI